MSVLGYPLVPSLGFLASTLTRNETGNDLLANADVILKISNGLKSFIFVFPSNETPLIERLLTVPNLNFNLVYRH